MVLRNGDRALIILLDGNEGKGAPKNGGVLVVDTNVSSVAGMEC